MIAPGLRVPHGGSRWSQTGRGALLALLVCVGTAAPAAAQSPGLQLQATPSPFYANTAIAITADVWMNGLVESFCPSSAWPPCVVLSVYTSAQVTRPGGFSAFTDTWDDWVTLQTSDPGPGQSMQSTTYTLTGTVVVTYCDWDIFLGDCHTAPQQYVEWGQTTATVVPYAIPSADSVAPSSGSGLSETFTFTYSSADGAAALNRLHFWFNPSSTAGTAASSCYGYYTRSAQTISLLTDAASSATSAVVGQGPALQNSQCTLAVAGASAQASGTTWTITVPVTFSSSWVGDRWVYLYAESEAGLDSGWQHRGDWTVPCTAQVTPNPVQLGAGSGQTSFSIDTPSVRAVTDGSTITCRSAKNGSLRYLIFASASPAKNGMRRLGSTTSAHATT